MRKQNLKKLNRLLHLLSMLDDKGLDVQKEALELGISERTIQRDLLDIDSGGFPLCKIAPGVYQFVEGFSLKKMNLSNSEASLLLFIKDFVTPLGTVFEEPFNSLWNKVLNAPEASPFYIKMPKGCKYQDTPLTRLLEEAACRSNIIKMTLVSNPKRKLDYEFHPIKIMNYDGFWYLLGVNAHKQVRKFRLDRILDAQITEKTFKIDKNIKKILQDSQNIWFGENRDKKVTFLIPAEFASYFKQKQYFPLQKIIKTKKNKDIIISAQVADYREILPAALSWLDRITIKSPKDFKDLVKDILEQALKKL